MTPVHPGLSHTLPTVCPPSSPQVLALALLLVEHAGHAVGELGPVRVQAAAPAGGEAREEPRLLPVGSVARTLLLARSAVARHLQPHVLNQVPTERCPAGLLDVQEHYHVLAFDLEVHGPLQVPDREVVFLDIVGVRSGEDVPLVFLREIPVRGAETDHPGSHVLIKNQHKTHRPDDDQQEFAAPLDHVPSQCALPFPSEADKRQRGAGLRHSRSPLRGRLLLGLTSASVRLSSGEVGSLFATTAKHRDRVEVAEESLPYPSVFRVLYFGFPSTQQDQCISMELCTQDAARFLPFQQISRSTQRKQKSL